MAAGQGVHLVSGHGVPRPLGGVVRCAGAVAVAGDDGDRAGQRGARGEAVLLDETEVTAQHGQRQLAQLGVVEQGGPGAAEGAYVLHGIGVAAEAHGAADVDVRGLAGGDEQPGGGTRVGGAQPARGLERDGAAHAVAEERGGLVQARSDGLGDTCGELFEGLGERFAVAVLAARVLNGHQLDVRRSEPGQLAKGAGRAARVRETEQPQPGGRPDGEHPQPVGAGGGLDNSHERGNSLLVSGGSVEAVRCTATTVKPRTAIRPGLHSAGSAYIFPLRDHDGGREGPVRRRPSRSLVNCRFPAGLG